MLPIFTDEGVTTSPVPPSKFSTAPATELPVKPALAVTVTVNIPVGPQTDKSPGELTEISKTWVEAKKGTANNSSNSLLRLAIAWPCRFGEGNNLFNMGQKLI